VDLATARLRLRDLTAGDAPFVLALMNEPAFIAHIGDRGVRTLADAERYITEGPWTRVRPPAGGLAAVQLASNGEPIGLCGLLTRDALADPDIGFAFLQRHWSKGYAFEAAAAVRDHARDVLHLPRLLAIVSPANTASIRLLEKLGFVFERKASMSDGAAEIAVYAVAFDTMPHQ
jgi:RimJ/RimL family protein N-acetyltransferase